MVNLLLRARDNFVFTGSRHQESEYYKLSLAQSQYFRRGTVVLGLTLILGAFTVFRYWAALPWVSRVCLLAALLWVIGVWGRTIADHTRVRNRLANAESLPITSGELLREAAGGATLGPWLTYAVALFLIIGWLVTIAHLESILASCQGIGK